MGQVIEKGVFIQVLFFVYNFYFDLNLDLLYHYSCPISEEYGEWDSCENCEERRGNEFLYSGNYFIYGGESSDGTNVFLRVGLSWIWITFRVDGNVRLGKKSKLSQRLFSKAIF